jgi:hypothetical protein
MINLLDSQMEINFKNRAKLSRYNKTNDIFNIIGWNLIQWLQILIPQEMNFIIKISYFMAKWLQFEAKLTYFIASSIWFEIILNHFGEWSYFILALITIS